MAEDNQTQAVDSEQFPQSPTPNSPAETVEEASQEQSTNQPEFENLGGKVPDNAVVPGQAPEPEKPKYEVIPFSDAEVVSGAAFIALLGGERLEMFATEEEKAIFAKSWMSFAPPTLKGLKIGEALAEYGIGKNSMPGLGQIEAMPAWMRLAAGGAAIGIGVYAGGMAVSAERNKQAKKTVEAEGKVKDATS